MSDHSNHHHCSGHSLRWIAVSSGYSKNKFHKRAVRNKFKLIRPKRNMHNAERHAKCIIYILLDVPTGHYAHETRMDANTTRHYH